MVEYFFPRGYLFSKFNKLWKFSTIDDHDVGREIEAVYTTRMNRVKVNLSLLKENSDKISRLKIKEITQNHMLIENNKQQPSRLRTKKLTK